MEIRHYDKGVSRKLLARFMENRLIFGISRQYESLISPSSTCLTEEEVRGLEEDLAHLWALYRIWTILYLKSVDGSEADWIRRFTEHELTGQEIRAHRMVATAGLEPIMCRVDYVSLGKKKRVAEVQWKSGGLGLFFGIQNVCTEVIPCDDQTRPLGDLAGNFVNLVCAVAGKSDPVAVNSVMYVWFKSEDYLRRLARDKGLHYFPIHRDELPGRMIERKGQYFVSEGKDLYPVDFLYGREFGTIFRQGLLRLVSTTLDGRIWMETPLNHIYRQKWGLALPFMARFRDLFDDRLRQVLIPAALIQGRRVDLSPIVPYLESPERQRLLAVRTIEDLAELPTSLRRALVFKCGAGRGGLHSHGKGVLRIGGSRGAARKILDFITERVESYNEPWIVQQYVDETHRIQVSLPEVVEEIQTLNAHARFMIFGRRSGGSPPTLMGGLGNYGKHWKVSGRSPDVDEHGNLMGTAFNDIRVVRPS